MGSMEILIILYAFGYGGYYLFTLHIRSKAGKLPLSVRILTLIVPFVVALFWPMIMVASIFVALDKR